MGYFLHAGKKLQPMTGLIHAWLEDIQKKGYRSGNLGLILEKETSPKNTWWGFSNFKTHFGITRVHLPGSYWKMQCKKRNKKSPHA